MQQAPFTTQNTPLASALRLCGFDVHRWNIYDENSLARIGASSVRDARVNKRKPGRIVYFCEHSESLARALAAWDDQNKRTQNGEMFSRDVFTEESDIEIEMRDAAHKFAVRNEMASFWMHEPGILQITGNVSKEGNFLRDKMPGVDTSDAPPELANLPAKITINGMKFISENASEETRKRMGL